MKHKKVVKNTIKQRSSFQCEMISDVWVGFSTTGIINNIPLNLRLHQIPFTILNIKQYHNTNFTPNLYVVNPIYRVVQKKVYDVI